MSAAPESFSLETVPLTPGVTLLEASAGTGKTHAIAGIYLRLVLETDLVVDRLLVVTFTEAATAELRGRIRARLAGARQFLRSGDGGEASDDALLRLGTEADRDRRRQRLEVALESFDAAAVFTIHGFCHRLLREHPLATGARFEPEFRPNLDALVQEAADNFWRRQFYPATGRRLLMALAEGLSPESLAALLQRHLQQAEPDLLPVAGGRSLAEVLADAEAALDAVLTLWTRDRDAIVGRFGEDGGTWGNTPYNRSEVMSDHWMALDGLAADRGTPEALATVRLLTPDALESRRSKRSKESVPSGPFFEACARLENTLAMAAAAWRHELLATAPADLSRLKHRDGVLGFDDLLHQVASALRGPEGATLVRGLRARYGAALIDEFQDTDPRQWEIFERAFGSGAMPLFLVGDPKQAIYSFRGADVFAYLRARQRADRRYTLGQNWRSTTGLVAAVNRIFQSHPLPFALPEIPFHPVTASGRADAESMTGPGLSDAPLDLWCWDPAEDGITHQEGRQEYLAEATASQIVRWLAAGVRLGKRPLAPGDIAVLVARHDEAEAVARALSRRGVPSVRQTQQNVFATPEADDLQILLDGLVDGAVLPSQRAVLVTELVGAGAASLAATQETEGGWESWAERFASWRRVWGQQGVLPLLERVLRDSATRRRLLETPDGERRLTNYLHLGELLQQEAAAGHRGPRSLAGWLSQQRAAAGNGGTAAEETLLRLERDAAAVQLVTVHRSKGLEYPVVLCPFPGREAGPRRGTDPSVLFHDPEEDHRLRHDVGSPGWTRHQTQETGEQFAENLRLLYVALTRARQRCAVVWTPGGPAGVRAMDWLLTPPSDPTGLSLDQAPEALERAVAGLDAGQARARAERLASPQITVSRLPAPGDDRWRPVPVNAGTFAARPFHGSIRRDWMPTSFSALVHGVPGERADGDDRRETVEAGEPPASLLPGFRGIPAGICLHDLLETIPFHAPDPRKLQEQVTLGLQRHGFDAAALADPLTDRVGHLLEAPWFGGHSLRSLPATDCWREMEFVLPLRTLTPDSLADAVAGGPDGPLGSRFAASLRRLTFGELRGILGGFVDLIVRAGDRWWLVDWKSNWLGGSAEDYDPEALHRVMLAEHYGLQYHLYLLALNRLLRSRIPDYDYDRDFGGVRYVFFRGVTPEFPDRGVFADRPSRALLERLDATLLEPMP
ncbi:MAG: exodeoxyribonuclease V subunit beta [Verrucomicrobia bacterium]|nr:exodeoxyribonuclease V subunit beta [Verrucomicrobiota bacterium]